MKKLFGILLITLTWLTLCQVVWAGEKPLLMLEGKAFTLDSAAILENGTTVAKVRTVVETLGASVQYLPGSNTVLIKRGNELVMRLTVDSNEAEVKGKKVTLPRPVKVIGGRTMAPVKVVAEALDYKVVWNQQFFSVDLRGPGGLDIPYQLWELDGQTRDYLWQDSQRNLAGDWYKDEYSQFMTFSVVTKEKQPVTMPPLQTLLPIIPPQVDFNEYMVLFGYLGEAPTGGHSIQFEEIHQQGDEIIIKVRTSSPPPGLMVTQGVNYPSEYVRIARKDVAGQPTFVFVDQRGKVLATFQPKS